MVNPLVHHVTHCGTCPVADGYRMFCRLAPRESLAHDGTAEAMNMHATEAPSWCPLQKAPVTLALLAPRSERETQPEGVRR